MPGNLTTDGANAILDGTTPPVLWYAALHTGNPGPAGTLNPATETRRLVITMDNPAAGAAVSAIDATMSFAAATETISHLVLWSASTGGIPWWVVPLAAPVNVTVGHTLRIPAGSLELAFELWS